MCGDLQQRVLPALSFVLLLTPAMATVELVDLSAAACETPAASASHGASLARSLARSLPPSFPPSLPLSLAQSLAQSLSLSVSVFLSVAHTICVYTQHRSPRRRATTCWPMCGRGAGCLPGVKAPATEVSLSVFLLSVGLPLSPLFVCIILFFCLRLCLRLRLRLRFCESHSRPRCLFRSQPQQCCASSCIRRVLVGSCARAARSPLRPTVRQRQAETDTGRQAVSAARW